MKDINATVIVSLEGTEEDILNRLQKDARWGINKAKKEQLTVSESNQWEEFYKVYAKTMLELGLVVESLEYLKSGYKKLFVCKKSEKIIGGCVLDISGENPRLFRAASLKEELSAQPNNLLYWQCITYSKDRGYKELDLGGWQINARGHLVGVNKFKERWGEVRYTHKDYPIHKAIGRKLIRKYNFFYWLNNKIKGRNL